MSKTAQLALLIGSETFASLDDALQEIELELRLGSIVEYQAVQLRSAALRAYV